MNFEKYTAKANEIVNELAKELDCMDNNHKSGRVLRAVLHALRNRLSVEESLQLISQLPMYLKALYVDGWKLNKQHYKIKHVDEFLDEVYQESDNAAYYDFPNSTVVYNSVLSVFKVLRNHISEGEIENIIATLPEELKELWDVSRTHVLM